MRSLHAGEQWWRKMRPELKLMRAITSNMCLLIFLLMHPPPTVRRTFGMTGAVVVVVSINRETFPHKSGWLALKSPVKCLLALGLCSIQPAAWFPCNVFLICLEIQIQHKTAWLEKPNITGGDQVGIFGISFGILNAVFLILGGVISWYKWCICYSGWVRGCIWYLVWCIWSTVGVAPALSRNADGGAACLEMQMLWHRLWTPSPGYKYIRKYWNIYK